jgi:hypothetical protein
MNKFFGLITAGLLLAGLSFADDTTAKQDVKQAGSDVKTAAKKTGSATKKTAKAAAKDTKKGVNKTAAKVEDKTK